MHASCTCALPSHVVHAYSMHRMPHAQVSGGVIKYNPQHFEWNFGFNLMSLGVSRQVNMSVLYERLASSVLSRRYLRGDSLVYGLGVPFMAYQDRIQCYSRDGWCVLDVHVHARSMYKPLIMLVFVHIRYVLDGLGYVPPAEMEVAGVTLKVRGHSHMHRWTCPCP